MAANETAGRLISRSFINASATVFAASMLLSIGGFLFHAIASRRLGVSDYGALYALISVYSLAGMPLAPFTTVIAKYAAEFRALHDDSHVRGLIDLIVRASVVCGAVYIAAAVFLAIPLGSFLHLPAWQLPIVGVMSAIGIFSGTMRAVGQGLQDYTSYGFSLAGEGITKVAGIALLALGGLTVIGGAGAFLMGMAVGAVLIIAPIARRYYRIRGSRIVVDTRRILATSGGAVSLTITMTLIGFGDVVLVKHFFPAHDAGLYSVASLCGKVLFYFVGFIPTVLIPQATHRHALGERTRSSLWLSLGFVAVVAAVGVVLYQVAGGALLHALAGKNYDAALPLLPVYASAMALLAMTTTLCSYGIATHRLGFAAPLFITTLGTLAFIAVVHPSMQSVVYELMLGNVVMVLATAIPIALQARRRSTT